MSETTSFVVLSSAAAGREADLRAWYEAVHLPDARAIPGVVAARVYENLPVDGRQPASHGFMAVYELEGDPAVVWAEFDRRIAEGVMAMSDALDPVSLSFSVWAPCAPGA